MLKRCLLIIATTTVIVATGIFAYLGIVYLREELAQNSEGYFLSYRDTGNLSDLLQSAVLQPRGERNKDITQILIYSGDYEIADLLNRFSPRDSYYYEAAEAALFNDNYTEATSYLGKTPDGPRKTELLIFADWKRNLDTKYSLGTTETNAGKLMAMVENKDFYLYTLNNELGRDLQENNKKSQGKIQNLLIQAQTLASNNLQIAALKSLAENDFSCNSEYYITKSNILWSINEPNEVFATLEDGLECDPSNQKVIKLALKYAQAQNEAAKVQFYQERLQRLTEVNR